MTDVHSRRRARLARFLSYYTPYRRLLIADLACAVGVSGVALALPLCARYITQNVLAGGSTDALGEIGRVGLLMLALVAVQAACELFVDDQGHRMGALMESDMRRDLFEHLQKLSFGFYDEQRTGQLMSRITNDLLSLAELYHHGPEDLMIAALRGVGAFIVLASINLPLTLVIFAFFPVMAWYSFYFNRRMNKALRLTRERIGDINAQVEDTLAGIRVVKSFTNESIEAAKFADRNARFLQSRVDGYRSEAYFSAGMNAFTQLFIVAVVVFGGMAIVNASLDLADLLIFLLYAGSLTEPISRAVNFARLYQEGLTGFDRFMEIMEIAPDIQDAPGAVDAGRVEGRIEFEEVGFRYREDHVDVVKNISLDIQAGEYVAVVGTSGVGKSTLCSLIPRFYEVTEGRIRIDGRDIRDLRLASLRANIGVVQQDVYLFAGTVAENIGYGKPGATRAEIVAAAQRAHAHAFVMGLPNGYDTDIGQRGVKLSGGQKQRLSIARVFLKNPSIIIFDEATSALDYQSERAVQDSLEQLTTDRTMLVIAHRLSTVRNAQRIVVLSEQGIEEQGTHDALIACGGAYAQLYNRQLRI